MTELQTAVKSWNTDKVIAWLSGLESVSVSEDVIKAFREHQIQGEDLLLLDREDLKDLSITRVPQLRKIRTAIDALKKKKDDNVGVLPSGNIMIGPISQRTKDLCPALHTLLGKELANELDSPLHVTETDAGYWLHVELMLVLRIVIILARSQLASSINQTHSFDDRLVQELPYWSATVPEIKDRLEMAEELLLGVEESLVAMECDKERPPLFAQVAEAYKIKNTQRLVVQFLVVVKVQRSAAFRLLLPLVENSSEEIDSKDVQFVCGVNKM